MKFKFNLRHSLLLIAFVPAIFTKLQVRVHTYELLNVRYPSPEDFGKFLIDKQASMTASYQEKKKLQTSPSTTLQVIRTR